MKKIFQNEQGTTLIELVMLIMVMGIAFPSIVSIVGQIAVYHSKNEINLKCENLASAKIEEIFAFKNAKSDWTNSIANFAGKENLPNSFVRKSQVNYHSDWEGTGIAAYEVIVTIIHPKLANGYSLKLLLTKYD